MNKRTGLALIILTTILAACTAQAAPAPTETPTSPPQTAAATTQPSATAEPTAVPTVTPTHLSPDAQALKDIVFSDCIPVEESLPEGFEIPWNLLVMQERIVYVLNLEDGTMTEVEYFSETTPEGYNKFVNDFFVSFDGKWLAYQDVFQKQLFVEPAGSILTNTDVDRVCIDWEKSDRFWLRRWVDNDTVLVYYWKSQEDIFATTVFLDPFTEQTHEFSLEELPNHKEFQVGGVGLATNYSVDGELSPNSTVTRIIYPEMYQEAIYNTLWDIELKSPLARVRHIVGMYNNPLWMPDEQDVILKSFGKELREDWFLFAENGTVKQITHFSEFVQEHEYHLSRQTRSNNGRFLAFRFSSYMSNDLTKYFVLDLTANTLNGFCVSSRLKNLGDDSPVWSPDSKYLIIPNIDRYNSGNIIMVDVETQTAYQIAKDLNVIGWITKSEGEK